MTLVLSTDYESLPTEPTLRWIKLRDLVEKRISEFNDIQEGVTDEILVEYCSILSAAAEELGVGELTPIRPGNIREDYEEFRSEVVALATKLSLRSAIATGAYSVALQRATKRKIHFQIERLRTLVSNSDLTEAQKKKLRRKLDELQSLISEPRTDFSKVMATLAIVGAGLTGTVSVLADGPDALGTITALIGVDKLEEDEDQKLIEAQKKPLQLEDRSRRPDLDDEIPF